MKNTKMLRAIGGIDDDLIERATNTHKAKRGADVSRIMKWAMPIAACLAVAAGVFFGSKWLNAPQLPASDSSGNPGIIAGGGVDSGDEPNGVRQPDSSYVSIDSIRGLPTRNYTWTEGDGIATDRMLTNTLALLMREFDGDMADIKAAVAIVKVSGVESFTDKNAWNSEGQIATCTVEYESFGAELPATVKIRQYLYGGCTNDDETNLLRVGGAYILPLTNWQNEGIWTVYADLECLFEIDDNGLIQSHSTFEQFNKYDGVELAYLWKDFGYLYLNPILRSRLAEYIGQGYDIAISGNMIALHYNYKDMDDWYGWDAGDRERFSAGIDANGRIEIATSGFNVFRSVEGMTLDEMEMEVDKIKRFLGLEITENTPAYVTPSETSAPIDGSKGDPSKSAVTSPEKAHDLLVEEYARQGFGDVTANLQAVSTLWEKVDVYLFNVTYGSQSDPNAEVTEYAAIVIDNGAFMRLEELPEGGFAAKTGALPQI